MGGKKKLKRAGRDEYPRVTDRAQKGDKMTFLCPRNCVMIEMTTCLFYHMNKNRADAHAGVRRYRGG